MAPTLDSRRTLFRQIASQSYAEWPAYDSTPLYDRDSLDALGSDVRVVAETWNVTHSADPIRADAVVTESGREGVQSVSVDYNVPSERFTDTSFTFEVQKSSIPPGTNPEEIWFERYSQGTWRTQDGRFVSESDSAYRFQGNTNGYSQFVITGPATAEQSGCELFGFDYGSFIVCWYWWLLLAVLGLVLASCILWKRGILASISNRDQNGEQENNDG